MVQESMRYSKEQESGPQGWVIITTSPRLGRVDPSQQLKSARHHFGECRSRSDIQEPAELMWFPIWVVFHLWRKELGRPHMYSPAVPVNSGRLFGCTDCCIEADEVGNDSPHGHGVPGIIFTQELNSYEMKACRETWFSSAETNGVPFLAIFPTRIHQQ